MPRLRRRRVQRPRHQRHAGVRKRLPPPSREAAHAIGATAPEAEALRCINTLPLTDYFSSMATLAVSFSVTFLLTKNPPNVNQKHSLK